MTREWRPGDVAMVESDTQKWRVFRTVHRGVEVWADANGPLMPDDEWVPNRTIRPLVVIDPEDREQVDTLCKALVEQMHRAGDVASAANGVHPATVAHALR